MTNLPQYLYSVENLFFKFNEGRIKRNELFFDLLDIQNHYRKHSGNADAIIQIKFFASVEKPITILELNQYLGKSNTPNYSIAINGMRTACSVNEFIEIFVE
jgi:hypothetical protein